MSTKRAGRRASSSGTKPNGPGVELVGHAREPSSSHARVASRTKKARPRSEQEALLAVVGEAIDAGSFAQANRILLGALAPHRRAEPAQTREIFERFWSSDGSERPVAIFAQRGDFDSVRFVLVAQPDANCVLHEIRWENGGWKLSGRSRSWRSRGSVPFRSTAYRCERDGDDYVVVACSSPGHEANDEANDAPRSLGELVARELRPSTDLTDQQAEYRMTLAPTWTWETRLREWAVTFVTEALHAEVEVEEP